MWLPVWFLYSEFSVDRSLSPFPMGGEKRAAVQLVNKRGGAKIVLGWGSCVCVRKDHCSGGGTKSVKLLANFVPKRKGK